MATFIGANRLSICLPVNSPQEQLAAARVVRFVRDEFHGLTISLLEPATFRGYWFNPETNELFEDAIAWLFTDLNVNEFPGVSLESYAEALRNKALEEYRSVDSEQLEIWVVFEPVTVHLKDG